LLRSVGVGELFLSEDNCVLRVGLRISFREEKRLDSVLEEVVVAESAVVEATAESESGPLGEPVLVGCTKIDGVRVDFGSSPEEKANSRSVGIRRYYFVKDVDILRDPFQLSQALQAVIFGVDEVR